MTGTCQHPYVRIDPLPADSPIGFQRSGYVRAECDCGAAWRVPARFTRREGAVRDCEKDGVPASWRRER